MEVREPVCNICGATRFVDRGDRRDARCTGCGADERTRLIWLRLADGDRLVPGARMLHLAPEAALAPRLAALLGDGYEPADLDPAAFPHVPGVRRLDLMAAADLPTARYDLIVHSHVLEHVPGNVTAILWHLHRALKPDGRHVCCIPFMPGRHSAEALGPLAPEEALARFGQADHVRIFGALDVERTLGMVFRLPGPFAAIEDYGEAALARHALLDAARRGWSPNSVLALRKEDLLLA